MERYKATNKQIDIKFKRLAASQVVVEIAEEGVPQVTLLMLRKSLVFSEAMQHSKTFSKEVQAAIGYVLINGEALSNENA